MSAPVADDGAARRAIGDRPALLAARLQLLAATRYRIALHLPVLEPGDYASADELIELRRIAISGRHADIRLLLHDPDTALREGHPLVALFQRCSSAFQVHTPVEDVDRQCAGAWLLTDTGGYLFRADARAPQGRMALADRAAQRPLQQQFNDIWERSARASAWYRLDL